MILSNGKPIEPTHSEPLAIYISGGITGVKNWQDIKILARCNAICMLPGWKRSKGARLEYRIAKILNMQILEFQPE